MPSPACRRFRIILCWKHFPRSGSSCIGQLYGRCVEDKFCYTLYLSFETLRKLGEARSGRPFGLAFERPIARRSLVSAKDLLWFFYLYPLRLATALLPVRVFLLIGRIVDSVCQRLTFAQKRRIRCHLEVAKRSRGLEQDLNHLADGIISNAVRRAMDDLSLDKLAVRGLSCTQIRGLEYLVDGLAQRKGVMVLSGHFYANRIAKRHLEQMGYPMLSVRNRRPPDAMMGRIGQRFLHQRYIEHLHGVIRDEVFIQDPECALKIFKRLRGSGIVHIYLDAGVTALRANEETGSPFWLPFLGTRGPFRTGFLQIARLSGCAAIPMVCLGDSRGFTITFDEPVNLARDVGAEEFVSDNLPRLVGDLESKILKHPEHWELWGSSNGPLWPHSHKNDLGMANHNDLEARVGRVLIDSLSLNIDEDDLQYSESLDQVMGLDSLAVLEFLTALEKEFGITIEQEKLKLALFRDLPALADYIGSLLDVGPSSNGQT